MKQPCRSLGECNVFPLSNQYVDHAGSCRCPPLLGTSAACMNAYWSHDMACLAAGSQPPVMPCTSRRSCRDRRTALLQGQGYMRLVWLLRCTDVSTAVSRGSVAFASACARDTNPHLRCAHASIRPSRRFFSCALFLIQVESALRVTQWARPPRSRQPHAHIRAWVRG